MKTQEICKVISQERIAEGIYSMWLEAKTIVKEAVPGQFVSLYTGDDSRLLPRPISLCEIDRERGALRLVYRVAGKGTQEFSSLIEGDSIKVLGPLGNGFPLEKTKGKRVLLMGGGIGIPPLLAVARQLEEVPGMICGYRDEVFLQEEMKACSNYFIATEDGSIGVKGNVLDVLKEQEIKGDIIFACGPAPMLRAIKEYAHVHVIECFLSMEEKMACGVGACLACVCNAKEIDHHSNVNNKRVCKDGPVFSANDIYW